MKKDIRFLFLAIWSCCISFVQTNAQVFGENMVLWTVGYGLGPFYESIGHTLQENNRVSNLNINTAGTFYGKITFGIKRKAAIGINMSYVKRVYNYNYKVFDGSSFITYWEEDNYSSFSLLLRLDVHGDGNDKIDLFIGTGIGYNPDYYTRVSNNPNGYSDIGSINNNPVGFEVTLGARFFILSNLGFYVETGYSKTIMQIGICGKF